MPSTNQEAPTPCWNLAGREGKSDGALPWASVDDLPITLVQAQMGAPDQLYSPKYTGITSFSLYLETSSPVQHVYVESLSWNPYIIFWRENEAMLATAVWDEAEETGPSNSPSRDLSQGKPQVEPGGVDQGHGGRQHGVPASHPGPQCYAGAMSKVVPPAGEWRIPVRKSTGIFLRDCLWIPSTLSRDPAMDVMT